GSPPSIDVAVSTREVTAPGKVVVGPVGGTVVGTVGPVFPVGRVVGTVGSVVGTAGSVVGTVGRVVGTVGNVVVVTGSVSGGSGGRGGSDCAPAGAAARKRSTEQKATLTIPPHTRRGNANAPFD